MGSPRRSVYDPNSGRTASRRFGTVPGGVDGWHNVAEPKPGWPVADMDWQDRLINRRRRINARKAARATGETA